MFAKTISEGARPLYGQECKGSYSPVRVNPPTLAAILGHITSFVLSLIIANAGAKRQIGFGWSLFLGIWLTPIVSLTAVLLSDRLQSDEYRTRTGTIRV